MLPCWTGWPKGQGGGGDRLGELTLSSWVSAAAVARIPSSPPHCGEPRSVQAVLSEGPRSHGSLGSVREEQICGAWGFSWETEVARLGPLGLSLLPVYAHTLSSGPGWPPSSPGHCQVGRKARRERTGSQTALWGEGEGGADFLEAQWEAATPQPSWPPELPLALPLAPVLPSGPFLLAPNPVDGD